MVLMTHPRSATAAIQPPTATQKPVLAGAKGAIEQLCGRLSARKVRGCNETRTEWEIQKAEYTMQSRGTMPNG